MQRRTLLLALAASPSLAATPSPGGAPRVEPWVHAYAAFGEPKYARGYDHFDYVNPNAPKGGTLQLRNPDLRTSFDKLNYYTIKGNAPAGIAIFVVETLAFLSADETQTMYGLLAEEMLVTADRGAVTFRRARRPAHRRRRPYRAARDAQAHAGRVPGSVRLGEPAHDRGTDRR